MEGDSERGGRGQADRERAQDLWSLDRHSGMHVCLPGVPNSGDRQRQPRSALRRRFWGCCLEEEGGSCEQDLRVVWEAKKEQALGGRACEMLSERGWRAQAEEQQELEALLAGAAPPLLSLLSCAPTPPLPPLLCAR
eukprot:261295-Rhodomonas_salina.1